MPHPHDRIEQGVSTQFVEGSVGERLFALAYRSAQMVHVFEVSKTEPPDARLAVLNASAEMAAALYLDVATISAALPATAADLPAPDVVQLDQSATAEARARAQVDLALKTYADYRALYEESTHETFKRPT